MAHTYTQVYIHAIIAVQGQNNLIPQHHLPELFRCATDAARNKGQQALAVGGMPDHLHLLLRTGPETDLKSVIDYIKQSCSDFINEHSWVSGLFAWQDGFGAFSHSRSQIEKVTQYIENQDKLHQKKNFKEEYLKILKNYSVDYADEGLFEWIDVTP